MFGRGSTRTTLLASAVVWGLDIGLCPWYIEGMRKIPLTRGLFALVSDTDFEFLSQWKWRPDKDGYAIATTSRTVPPRKTIKMHRVIMARKLGHDFDEQVDHKDRDRLNNCRRNLRLADSTSQRANATRRTGRFKGVWWYKPYSKWQSQITCRGKRQHLGYFENQLDAAKAYDKAALKLFGEFASLNLPAEV